VSQSAWAVVRGQRSKIRLKRMLVKRTKESLVYLT
jgi:hypothetical protein